MPTSRFFDKIPPFPDEVPVADIPTISLPELIEESRRLKERPVSETLFKACQLYGFFLLELEGSREGETLLKDAETMFDLSTELFALGDEVLERYAYQPPKNLLGYKGVGQLKVDDGSMDAIRLYTIGQDETLGIVENFAHPVRGHPPLLEARREDCANFLRHSHEVVAIILRRLDRCLGLEDGTLASTCRLDKASQTSFWMLMCQPSQPTQSSAETTINVCLFECNWNADLFFRLFLESAYQ
ncbi:uncharacterized protein Z518_00330 [Rhinocladiella mackenziei CBS 650.93]|uniref:Rhinocladiella mackenziei CBS 650.93 unplaced genomic scaffold supercont1.1, whole genome shotgun sequence n=1 Tax=Rhinocladiella mackenziei CBS 650.93 TaxID=1442369 RepID=A0A0D2J0P1_9EURO|nr:uncharacterized protein Z518_00330 [Rhinocladiella mackenziei CBS 650.93]KIX09251.1 hypothetical protein Z518_00330 [Rhinocladiella mackenziei CBS 650.93]